MSSSPILSVFLITLLYAICSVLQPPGFSSTTAWLININHFFWFVCPACQKCFSSLSSAEKPKRILNNLSSLILIPLSLALTRSSQWLPLFFFFFLSLSNLHAGLFRTVVYLYEGEIWGMTHLWSPSVTEPPPVFVAVHGQPPEAILPYTPLHNILLSSHKTKLDQNVPLIMIINTFWERSVSVRSSSRPAQTNSIVYLLMCGELTVLFPFLSPSQRASYGTKITRWWCRLTARWRTPGSSTSGPLQSLLCSGSTTQTQYTSTRRQTTRPRLPSACSWALPKRTSDACILFAFFYRTPLQNYWRQTKHEASVMNSSYV